MLQTVLRHFRQLSGNIKIGGVFYAAIKRNNRPIKNVSRYRYLHGPYCIIYPITVTKEEFRLKKCNKKL
jgi:hypothetical protein